MMPTTAPETAPRGATIRGLLPAIIAFMLLGAHFYRDGLVPLVPSCIGAIAMLFVRLPWVRYLAVGALVLAAAEWSRTLVALVAGRIEAGEPWLRLASILVAVAAFTLLSAWPFRSAVLRRWYAGGRASAAPDR